MIFSLTSSIQGAHYVSFPSPILFGSLCPFGRIDSFSRNSFFLPLSSPLFPSFSIPLSLTAKEKPTVILLPPLPYPVYAKLLFRKSSLWSGKGKHRLYPSLTGCPERQGTVYRGAGKEMEDHSWLLYRGHRFRKKEFFFAEERKISKKK
jgi:hypothetical protein